MQCKVVFVYVLLIITFDLLLWLQPPSLATLALTESSLLRYHSDQPVTVTLGPLPQEETLNSQNRWVTHFPSPGSVLAQKTCRQSHTLYIPHTMYTYYQRRTCELKFSFSFPIHLYHTNNNKSDRDAYSRILKDSDHRYRTVMDIKVQWHILKDSDWH